MLSYYKVFQTASVNVLDSLKLVDVTSIFKNN